MYMIPINKKSKKQITKYNSFSTKKFHNNVCQFKSHDQADSFQFIEPIVRKSDSTSVNNPNIPDNLKTSLSENLNYDPFKSAQLNTIAYTQRSNIHTAPRQEKNHTYEANVVQLKVGNGIGSLCLKNAIDIGDQDPSLENQGSKLFQNPVPAGSFVTSIKIDYDKSKIEQYKNMYELQENTSSGIDGLFYKAEIAKHYHNLYEIIINFLYFENEVDNINASNISGKLRNINSLITYLGNTKINYPDNNMGFKPKELNFHAREAINILNTVLYKFKTDLNSKMDLVMELNHTWHHIYPRSLLSAHIKPLGKFLNGLSKLNKKYNINFNNFYNAMKMGFNEQGQLSNNSTYYWNPANGFFGPPPEKRLDDPKNSPEKKCPKYMNEDKFNNILYWGKSLNEIQDYLEAKRNRDEKLEDAVKFVLSKLNIPDFDVSPHSNINDWKRDEKNYTLISH